LSVVPASFVASPDPIGRGPVGLGSGRDQAIVEDHPPVRLLTTEPLDDLGLGLASTRAREGGQHRVDDADRGGAYEVELGRRLDRAHRLRQLLRLDERRLGQLAPQDVPGIHTAGETQTSLAMHRPILAAIEDGDPDAARQAMTAHMARAVHWLRESMPAPLDRGQLPD
jgi:hypothetical protein